MVSVAHRVFPRNEFLILQIVHLVMRTLSKLDQVLRTNKVIIKRLKITYLSMGVTMNNMTWDSAH